MKIAHCLIIPGASDCTMHMQTFSILQGLQLKMPAPTVIEDRHYFADYQPLIFMLYKIDSEVCNIKKIHSLRKIRYVMTNLQFISKMAEHYMFFVALFDDCIAMRLKGERTSPSPANQFIRSCSSASISRSIRLDTDVNLARSEQLSGTMNWLICVKILMT